MGKNKLLLPIILIIFAILAVFCALTLKIGFVVTIKLFSSFLLVFFVPGIIWSFAILGEGKQIAWILRLVFAFAFSIFSVPLIEFYSNHLFKIAINRTNILFEITIFSFVGLVIYFIRYLKQGFKKFILILVLAAFIFSPLNAGATVLPFDNSSLKIVKVAGDKQVINIGQDSGEVKAKVVDENNNAIPGIEVIFTLYDSDGKMIGTAYSTITDKDGYAIFKPNIKNKGKYTVKAEIKNGSYVTFELNMAKKGKISGWFWLLLIIPIVLLIYLSIPNKHWVYEMQKNIGIASAAIDIEWGDYSLTKNFITNGNGNFRFRFSKNNYRIRIKKIGFKLKTLDNHLEFNTSEDGWSYFTILKHNERLYLGMKQIKKNEDFSQF